MPARYGPNILLRNVELSTRAATALLWDNLKTVQDVAAKTDADLLRLPNIGRLTLKEIRAQIPHQPELAALDAANKARLAGERETAQKIQQALGKQEIEHYKRVLLLETIVAKCAAQFKRYAAEARHGIGKRGSNEDDMRKLDDALTHDMMAGMCERALKE